MPYFVYKISQIGALKQLGLLGRYDAFKEASAQAKELRSGGDLHDGITVKVVFADNELQAEDLLQQVREPEPMVGDDY